VQLCTGVYAHGPSQGSRAASPALGPSALARKRKRGYARVGDRVRKVIGYMVIALVAAGCRDATASTPPATPPDLQIRESPSPYTQVTAGAVTAMVPDRWHPQPFVGPGNAERGFIASPAPDHWADSRAPVEGMAALWVDGTRVGVPSDYYYLAATGPALDLLTDSARCSSTSNQVVVNHRPSFADGPPDSPGDYMAVGQGVCQVHHTATRWAYFVAAPGYGPVREVGIPSSGLYVVVAVMRDSPRAAATLDRLVNRTQFGGASVTDFIAAAWAA
jgi:hypothetical protein